MIIQSENYSSGSEQSVKRRKSCVALPSELESCNLNPPQSNDWNEEVWIQDFVFLKTLSSGAFGKVILARKKSTQDILAIKVLDKKLMIEKKVTVHIY